MTKGKETKNLSGLNNKTIDVEFAKFLEQEKEMFNEDGTVKEKKFLTFSTNKWGERVGEME